MWRECGLFSLLPQNATSTHHICGEAMLPFRYNKASPFYHYYEDFTVVCSDERSAACTIGNVFDIMTHTPAALAPVNTATESQNIHSCAILQLRSCPPNRNLVRLVIDPASHSITNYTLRGHVFFPGQIKREVIKVPPHDIVIHTIGEGVGCDKELNVSGAKCKIWPDADEALRVATRSKLGLGTPPSVLRTDACSEGLGALMWTCDALWGN